MNNELEILQALPSLYPLTETEEKAVIHITTRHPVKFMKEGYDDRVELCPICPSCGKDLYNDNWDFCPYCGIPLEWDS